MIRDDYSKLKKPELVNIAKDLKISKINKLKKAGLLEIILHTIQANMKTKIYPKSYSPIHKEKLLAVPSQISLPKRSEDIIRDDTIKTEYEYIFCTREELNTLAKNIGIKGYGSKTRSKLIQLLKAYYRKKLVESLVPADINLFYTVGVKKENDINNKKRELILKSLNDPDLTDKKYRFKWLYLQFQWNKILKQISDKDFDYYEVKMTGGRSFNYDFLIYYYKSENIVLEKKIEFKFNSTSIEKLPQFLSLPTSSPYLPESYESYFYDHFLKRLVDCDPSVTTEIPEKSIYIKSVTSNNYNIHPFFKKLYDNENNCHKVQKSQIVNESIYKYLKQFHLQFDIELFLKKIIDTQENKMFILWDIESKTFLMDKICIEKFNDLEVFGIKNKNVLVLSNKKMTVNLLLRWKNHKGILLPAWQISLQNIK